MNLGIADLAEEDLAALCNSINLIKELLKQHGADPS